MEGKRERGGGEGEVDRREKVREGEMEGKGERGGERGCRQKGEGRGKRWGWSVGWRQMKQTGEWGGRGDRPRERERE